MKTLYVNRKVNAESATAIREWAIDAGIKNVYDIAEMHVTIAYSTEAVDWDTFTPNTSKVSIKNGTRTVTMLGDNYLVLAFDSDILQNEWKHYIDGGCSWDYDEYQSHVSISENVTDPTMADNVTPFTGNIVLERQMLEEIDENY
jgi:hypothetical protein